MSCKGAQNQHSMGGGGVAPSTTGQEAFVSGGVVKYYSLPVSQDNSGHPDRCRASPSPHLP